MTSDRRRSRSALLALALAPVVAGCSGGLTNVELSSPSKIFDFETPRWALFTAPPEEKKLPEVTPADLVGPDGACSPGDAPPAERAISLEMTECDVVRLAGTPERVDIRANPANERLVVLTYSRGQRPGIYEFVGGRLKVIERAPEPARPQRMAPPRRKSA
jgi:hypothetical protein